MSGAMRDMREGDIPKLDRLLSDAYGVAGTYERRLRDGFTSHAARTIVCDDGGALVGMATLHDYDEMGYVALLGVAPSRQGRGVGTRIMEAIMQASVERGHRLLALEASDAGKPLYDALGFKALGSTLGFEGPAQTKPPTDKRIRRAERDDCDLICAYDAVAFGGDRSATIRQYFAQDDRAIFIADDGNAVGGYVVADGIHVGPLLAQTPGAAGALLDAACAALGVPRARISVPAENLSALALVAQRGWLPITRHTHMARGKPVHFPRRALYGLMSLGEG